MSAAPICSACQCLARLTSGEEIYPHRRDLWSKPVWICDGCKGYVGCHPGTQNPLGTPAILELRIARARLHQEMIDPLWKTACDSSYKVETRKDRLRLTKLSRTRVYEFLAHRLGIPVDACHVGHFDLARCRDAWRVLKGVTYAEIRAWAKAQRESEAA